MTGKSTEGPEDSGHAAFQGFTCFCNHLVTFGGMLGTQFIGSGRNQIEDRGFGGSGLHGMVVAPMALLLSYLDRGVAEQIKSLADCKWRGFYHKE